MDKYQTRPRYMYNILYRIGDDGAIAIPTLNMNELRERHFKLQEMKPKDTQVLVLGGLDYYAEYQPVTTMTFEEAIEFLKKDGRISNDIKW